MLKANLHAKGNGYNKTLNFMVKQEFGNVSCPLKVSANMERALSKKKYINWNHPSNAARQHSKLKLLGTLLPPHNLFY